MRSPSERLSELLTTSGLCTRAQLEQCEPFVRQLCQDLPDFDSVWLDALIQQRVLTPWQADQILHENGVRLSAGRYQLQESLGRKTYLAKDTQQGTVFVLRSLEHSDAAQNPQIARRMEELLTSIERPRNSAPASLILPTEMVAERSPDASVSETGHSVYLVTSCVRGWSMEELLIRGGRLPSAVVAEIGRELLVALAWLESSRLLHGDIVTRNVRLSTRGGVHLTAPFVKRFLQPQFAMTQELTLRDCDGVAPELAGTGRTADSRSELYALGCLLWQLLTSRPVVLTADPVTRLMKQKDHDIVDVRIPVPDCPEWMSRIILSLTRRSPELRPASAAEVLKQWRTHSGNGLSACKALARSMPDHSLRSRTQSARRPVVRKSSWIWPATATAVLATLVILTARSGVLPKTLTLSTFSDITAALTSTADNAVEIQQPSASRSGPLSTGPLPLPAVDVDGFIRLEPGQEYLAEPREFPGSLQIVCKASPTAKILIREDVRWQLRARAIAIQGVTLSQRPVTQNDVQRPAKTGQKIARQMLEAQCSSLAISDCVIQSPASADNFQGIEWRRPNSEAGIIMIRSTVFAGGGYGLSFNHPPHRCELENVLFANRGSGMLCEFQKGDAESWNLLCTNVTQRFGFSLLDTVIQKDGLKQVQINLTSSECVYSPQMAIVRLQAPEVMRPDAMRIEFRAGESGNPAVVPPDTRPAVYIDRRLNQPVSLPEAQVTDTSLLLAELTFYDGNSAPDDERSSEWFTAALFDFEGPKLTPIMPGIDPVRLPRQVSPRN